MGLITRAINIIQKYGTTSFAIVSRALYHFRSSETQLTACYVTISNVPYIITDRTPAKVWMTDFNSSTPIVTYSIQ